LSILAGIFARTSDASLLQQDVDELKQAISRSPSDDVTVFRDERICLAKVDVGAFGVPAFRTGLDGSASMLAGEPFLSDDDDPSWSREQDLALLHSEIPRGDTHALRRARGFFAAAHYQVNPCTLTLVTDKLGVRMLYYWQDEHYVVFATAIRIIEGLRRVPKEMDLRGVTEIACLGYALGERTPYAGVYALRPAETVRFSGAGTSKSQYWRWEAIEPQPSSEEALLRDVYDRFTAAVKRRLRSDTVTVSYLSGGLDSRCVVAVLRNLNAAVHTFTFAPRGTQDFALAPDIAQGLGTMHEQHAVDSAGHDQWLALLAEAWRDSKTRLRHPPQRPQMVWSGDGGSVGLGHVYLSDQLVGLLRSGRRETAIEIYLRQHYGSVLGRLMNREIYQRLRNVPLKGIEEELDDIRCGEPARQFYLFLMFNDQRRHLVDYLENVDLHRLELHEPFYDSDLLESIMRGPTDLYIGHRFYTKWMRLFPSVVTSVPWQTYQGHEPCPLPLPPGLATPWNGQGRLPQAIQRERKRRLLADAYEMLHDTEFAANFARRPYLLIVTEVYRTGLRDYSYVIETAKVYYRYWIRSAGRYRMPAAS